MKISQFIDRIIKAMKKNIHPKLNKVVFVDVSNNEEFPTVSVISGSKTKKIDGEDYQVIPVQISSTSHPFYTGKHRVVDTENLVKKFEKKAAKASTLSEKLKKSKEKKVAKKTKVQSVKATEGLTLKDMLKQMQG